MNDTPTEPSDGYIAHRQRPARISLVGDVLTHRNLLSEGSRVGNYKFERQFEVISPAIRSADCASANLETIAAGEEYGISGYPKFNAPEQLLDGLVNAGFDIVSVANNHMLDKGEDALLTSIRNAKQRGLGVTGAADSEPELAAGVIKNAHGIRVGFVSFTDGAKIRHDKTSDSRINFFPGETAKTTMFRRLIKVKRQLRAIREHADIVVLQLHYGHEYHRTPSHFQRELVTSVCEFDVDVIVGHHPHVLQPVEWIENSKGRSILVAYSLGNFFSGQIGLHRQIGGILSFTVERRGPQGKVLVSDPRIKLTYVDDRDRFIIKPFKDIADRDPTYFASRSNGRRAPIIYDNVTSALRSMDSSVAVV